MSKARNGLMSDIALESDSALPVNKTDEQNTDTQFNPDPTNLEKPDTLDLADLSKIQEDIVAIESELLESAATDVAVTDALNVSESLTNGMGLLDDLMQGDKLTPMSARVMEIATESMCKSINLDPGPRVALEDDVLGKDDVDTSKMKEAGQGLLKKMGEKIKQIFLALVKMFRNSIQDGKAFFQRIFTSVGQLKDQFQKLATSIKGWGDATGADHYANSQVATMLSLDGETGGVSGIVKNLNALSEYNTALQNSGYSQTVADSVVAIDGMIKNSDQNMFAVNRTKAEAFNDFYGKFVTSVGLKAFNALRMSNRESATDVTGPPLIGNVAMVSKNDLTTMYRNGYYGVRFVNGNHFGLVQTEGAKRSEDSLPIVNASEAKQILDAAHKAITVAESYKKISDEQVAAKNKIADTLEKMTKQLESVVMGAGGWGKNQNFTDIVPLMQAYLNFCMRMIEQLPRLLEGHTVKVLFAVLNWLNHCDKVHTKGSARSIVKGSTKDVADNPNAPMAAAA